jgi:hypothetical protein
MPPNGHNLAGDVQRDLVPVNAVIGFLKRDKKWPSGLYRLGYRLALIEQPVSTASHGTAEVDVICLSQKRNHAILWECKSGSAIHERQARVYAAITAEDVQRTGNLTFPHAASASVEPPYCCLEPDERVIMGSLRSWGLGIPVVSLGSKAKTASGQFADADVSKLFAGGIPLPPLEEVPRFLIANAHTPKWRLAGPLVATMVSFLRKQTGKFSLRHLLEETFNDWDCMGTDLRRHLTSAAREISKDLCENELQGLAEITKARTSPGEILMEFTVDVLGVDASTRTRTFQRLLRLASEYVDRTKENRPYQPAQEFETPWLSGLEPE